MKRGILVILLLILFATTARTQSSQSHQVRIVIPKVALIDMESAGSSAVVLSLDKPNEAGHGLQAAAQNSSGYWVNYSSVLASGQPERKVMASLSGNIPEGVKVLLVASPYSGEGKGKNGIPSGKKILSGEPTEIISNIGSCYTGNGVNNGHLLTFSLEVDEGKYEAIRHGDFENLRVTYTLTE